LPVPLESQTQGHAIFARLNLEHVGRF
jgi:hypothetical protein